MAIRSREKGFTLIEMIITLMVLSILGAAAGYALSNGALAFVNSSDTVHTIGKLRVANERMAREIREVRRDLVTPAQYDISTMNTTTLAFNKTDGTSVTLNAAPPLVTLVYSNPAGTHTLTDEVSALTFSYYQADGSTAATGNSDVVFIEFELVLTHSGNLYPQRTRVALRNQP
jgi:prepilin-type N-terminal cleavage/methylation domain-containing protein